MVNSSTKVTEESVRVNGYAPEYVCKDYQKELNLCKRQWIEVIFDDTICQIQKDDSSLKSGTENIHNEKLPESNRRIVKRGSPVNVHNQASDLIREKTTETKDSENNSGVFTINMTGITYKVLVLSIALIILGGITGIAYYFYDKHESEERELLVGQTRLVLDDIKQDNTLGCIKLVSYDFNGESLSLSYWLEFDVPNETFRDSLEQSFMYLASLHSDKWKSLRELSGDRQIDINVVFNSKYYCDSVSTTLEKVCTKIEDKVFFERAMYVFAEYKLIDIKEYTEKHFKKNGLLTFVGVRLDKDFVRLALSFDDSQVRIGKTMLDSTRIDPNFTDKVGERGSILKELFSICARTHRGFKIEYLGTHNKTHHVLSWNYERAMNLKPLFELGVNN